MSADNWTHCPRCAAVAEEEFRKREAAIHESYGTVPVNEFDKARRKLAEDRANFDAREMTFREDYEIFGADTGTVKVKYSGQCQECGLGLDFTDSHPIPGLEIDS